MKLVEDKNGCHGKRKRQRKRNNEKDNLENRDSRAFFVLKVQVFVHPGINPHLLIILAVVLMACGSVTFSMWYRNGALVVPSG